MLDRGVMEMVTEAKERIENLSPSELAAELAESDVVLVDLREEAELREQGAIPGAIHAPRGMLEFYADPATPYHRAELDPDRRTVLYCASGGRSALAASNLMHMGFRDVAHLDGGFKAWAAAGNPVERASGS